MRRLRALDAKRARTLRIADAEYAAIKAWADEQLAPVDHEAANLRRVIEGYALAVRERSGGRTKSVSFPAGVVKTVERTCGSGLRTRPSSKARLMTLGRFLRTTVSIDKAGLKKAAMQKDGLVAIDVCTPRRRKTRVHHRHHSP